MNSKDQSPKSKIELNPQSAIRNLQCDPLRILILDDVPTDAELVKRELKKAEIAFTSRHVETRDSFLKELEDFSPDIVLSDYMMPQFTGREALELVKERYPSIPLIIVTGSMNEETAVECMKAGAVDYVIKENLIRLGQAVVGALEKKKLKDQKEKTEEALRESEKKYRTVMEANPDPVIVYDIEGNIVYLNPAFTHVFGWSYEERIGKKIDVFVPEKNWSETEMMIEKVLSGESFSGIESCRYTKEGKIIPVGISGAVYRDQEGNPVGNVVNLRDITEEKKLQDQLSQAQKMEAIGTLAGGIAHDFNNLLTTIIGNAQLALNDISKDDSLRKQIEEIKKAGERSASLTRQLLAFSRKQVIKPVVLDLNEVINETAKMLKRMIGEDIEFQTVLKPELWKVHMDSGQIDQIIINIAVNARDAMPQGGKLTIETTNVDLDKAYFRDHGAEGKPGSYVMLAISDTGSGMDKETREHIFEPFFTTKEIGKGTGLGLSTVYGIAKQNNGFIWVYSEPGQGTTFKIYLPKVKEGAEAEEKERTPVGDLNGSETVFIVEDDDRVRNLARKVLERYGYSVLEAENGEDALRVNEEYEGQIDLMLTDVVMPKMSGRETAERLQPLYPQMKVIYMSGYTDNAIVHHGVLAEGLNFLEKPFTPEGLARKVREVLDR